MSGNKLVFGNWKMHLSVKQSVAFAEKLAKKTVPPGVKIAVAPNTLALVPVSETLAGGTIASIAQNAHFKDEGAFTGEVAMPMLRGVSEYVLIGHSERRHVFHESNEQTRAKMAAAVRSGIKPVLCIGETLVEREHHHTNYVLNDQLTAALADLTSDEVAKVVIAYEPVWAIGTGKYARPGDVTAAVKKIRNEVSHLYGYEAANKCKVLYGGSVDAHNCAAYLALDGVDGLLVGGASLGVTTFWPIVEAAAKAAQVTRGA